MQTSKQEKIDQIINDLETFIDLRYKINKETDYCNHSFVFKMIQDEYVPAKKKLEESLKELLT